MELLARPDAAVARQIITAARASSVAPTVFLGLRMITQTYVYDDLEHPDRPTSTILSPAYTAEDQALLMGLDQYEADLCNGCHVPRSIAWHPEMDGYFDTDEYVCHACTAQAPEPPPGKSREEVKYVVPRNTRPDSKGPLPPFLAT